MPTRSEIVVKCDAYIAAVSAGDVDAIMALYSGAAVVEDPVGTDPKVGPDAIRAFYEQSVAFKLDCKRMGPVTVVGNRAAFMFSVEVDLGASKLAMATIDVMTFDDDGKVLTMTAYADGDANPEG